MNDDTREQVRMSNEIPKKNVLAIILELHEFEIVQSYMNRHGFKFSKFVPISMNPGKLGALFTRITTVLT